jgi:uncharacterized OB-fold protein
VDCSGRATLDSYIINHAPAPGFDDPHIIAIISLEEGPRMATSIVGVPPDPAVLKLDMPLQVDFETRGDHLVPVFRPIGA